MNDSVDDTESIIFIKPLEFDQKQIDEVLHLLYSWGLTKQTCDIILASGVCTVTHLECLEREDINEIFEDHGKTFIGEKSQFLNKLRTWRNNKEIPLMCDRDTLDGSTESILQWLQEISSEVSSLSRSSSLGSSPNIEQNVYVTETQSEHNINLEALLQSSIRGKIILAFYEQYSSLESKHQKEICHLICDFHNSKKLRMSYADMQNWANSIEILFPNEKSVSYNKNL